MPLIGTRRALIGGANQFSISDVFANGLYQGFDFTNMNISLRWGPSSLPLLYKDQANSLVIASGDTVGTLLDKSGGGPSIGSELVINGSFTSNINGWTDASTGTGGPIAWDAGNGGRLALPRVDASNNARARQSFTSVVGALYMVVISTSTVRATLNLGTSAGGGQYMSTLVNPGSAATLYFRTTTTTTFIELAGANNAATSYVDDISIKNISGNHALQTTSGSRPTYIQVGRASTISGDGSDDGMFGALLPGPSMTLIAAVLPNSSSAGTDIVIGAAAAGPASRCQLGIVDGVVSGGWGSDSVSTIKDAAATDIRNVNSVISLRANASGVKLNRMTAGGSFLELYAGSPNGTATTADAPAILANNANGTLNSFFYGGMTGLGVKRYLTDNQLFSVMQQMATLAFG